MGAVADLVEFGADIGDPVAVAKFIAGLNLSGQMQARLLRDYIKEMRLRLTREILIEARDYSFYL